MEMNRDAKCTRFSVPNRHLQPVITTVKQPKVEEITSLEIRSSFSSKKNESLISQLSLRWEKSKVLMDGELLYFNQD
jgi:hypothetical protein